MNANDFRDLMILIPENQLQTVLYYMKVGLDIGTRRLPIPDRRKDGKPWGHLVGRWRSWASRFQDGLLRHSTSHQSSIHCRGRGVRVALEAAKCGVRCRTSRARRVPAVCSRATCPTASAALRARQLKDIPAYKGLLTGNDREPTNCMERLLAGSLAGMTSDSILYPLEVVSTRVTMNMSKTGATNIPRIQDGGDCEERGDPRSISLSGRGDGGRDTVCRYIFRLLRHPERAVQEIRRVDSAGSSSNARDVDSFHIFWPPPSRFHSTARWIEAADRTLAPVLVGKQNLVSVTRYTIAKDGYKGLFNGMGRRPPRCPGRLGSRLLTPSRWSNGGSDHQLRGRWRSSIFD